MERGNDSQPVHESQLLLVSLREGPYGAVQVKPESLGQLVDRATADGPADLSEML